jgi:hypothetical protein
MRERNLYPILQEFLKDKLGCFHVARTTGTRYGAIDVVGLRQSSGKYGGNAEVIAVEVKASGSRFLNSAGQVLGYSVMADRCYLALPGLVDESEPLESEFAAQLNNGLLRVGPGKKCEVVVTSPQHRPLRAQKLALIRTLGFIECAMCGTLRAASSIIIGKTRKGALQAAAQKGKGFRYLLSNIDAARGEDGDERRYLCRDRVRALSGA